jgi:hypothetical protein
MGTLTKRNLAVVVAPSSSGVMYAVSGVNKLAREALAKDAPYLGAKKTPSGYFLFTKTQLRTLVLQIEMGIAA